jgi:hypothetical protein
VSAHVRATDPDTSRDAALAIEARLNPQCARVYRAITEIDSRNGGQGATSHDIVLRLAYGSEPVPDQNVIARRCTDLRDAGLVSDLGDRRMGGRGQPLIVWMPVRNDGQGVLL